MSSVSMYYGALWVSAGLTAYAVSEGWWGLATWAALITLDLIAGKIGRIHEP